MRNRKMKEALRLVPTIFIGKGWINPRQAMILR
jgi:hypothetical protein